MPDTAVEPLPKHFFHGDFSVTTEIIPFDTLTPPLNTWAYRVNEENGADVNPSVVDGVAEIQILNPGYDYPDVQLTQVGFLLNQGHVYQLNFDVRADSDRYLRLFLGEEGGNAINLLEEIYFYVTTGWQTIRLEFKTTSVFDLHKLSFELGGNDITTYFDNVILQDLGPAPPEKVVIAGTFQSAMGCETDWDVVCEITELTFDPSTELYTGTFEIPEGNHRYKLAVGGSWDINYGENGEYGGADIFLCVPAGSEEVTFTYDPATHLVTTSPIMSGFSPDCLPVVVLAGSFQDELGCVNDWMPDCSNTALIYNTDSGLFEGDFNIPPGCYYYRIYLENSWFNSFGKDGIFNGENYDLYIPSNSETTHFTYDPVTHVANSSPYGNPPQEVTQVFLVQSLQEAMGCNYNGEYDCANSSLVSNPETGIWENSFVLPEGCYTYRIREIFGCEMETLYGQSGEPWGEELQLYVSENREIHFRYDPETHLIESTPFSEVPQEVTKVTLIGSFEQEIELALNSESGDWEKTSILPAGCYNYLIEETFGCNTISFYGENGTEGTSKDIQIYVPEDGEITFTYDPETHLINSTPYSAPEILKVSITGTIQDVLCPDYYSCDKTALTYNSETGLWVGDFTLPKGCYTYQVQQVTACNTLSYGENGEMGSSIQLYVPSDGEVSFSYDPKTHATSSSPYSGTPQEVTAVALEGSSFQNELLLNTASGLWEGNFTLSEGCYTYWVKETFGCVETYYGENGNFWPEVQLYVPTEAEITFSYDPQTHLITSSPFSGNPQEATAVSIEGSSFQNELTLNTASGLWEGSFTLSEGCYTYQIREVIGCNENYYGENGEYYGASIELYVPAEAEITFSYDPETHTMTSNPYSGIPEEITSISLFGELQNELGCPSDNDPGCESPALVLNSDSGVWEGTFYLPAKCYTFLVKETFTCSVAYYGENGENWSPNQLYVPAAGEITFSYDPQTHIVTSTPYYPVPEEVTAVSLVGSFQTEFGCDSDEDLECDKPALALNPATGLWEGSFTLSAGCYTYRVKEKFGCEENYYGKNGEYWTPIELFVPDDGEITFSYDPQSHNISSTPYSGVPQELTAVSLVGSIQNGFDCDSVNGEQCDKPALNFNSASGHWEGSFTLPAGCYDYKIEERFGCNEGILFGENGQESGEPIQLYVPSNGEITFSYDPQTHLINSTPYADVPREMTKVSLSGTLQDELGCAFPGEDECENSALEFDPASGIWKGNFTLPARCYSYRIKEVTPCGIEYYGENGGTWGDIQLYLPEKAEITFSYDPQTHLVNSTPYSGVPEKVTSVTLYGSLQNELGCDSDEATECHKPALALDTISGLWEGSFTLPSGCYSYWVRETFGCDATDYGENGLPGENIIELYVPEEGEITFSYDPQTHTITSTPYSGVPQEPTAVSLTGTLLEELGCSSDWDYDCENSGLQFNPDSGFWEANFTLPAGCYYYQVRETSICKETFYGENGYEGYDIRLYVPTESEISFSYDPDTHIMNTSPYSGVPEEVTSVALLGYFGDSVSYPSLTKNESSGNWEGSFELPAGCYTYWVVETVACWNSYLYGENGEAEANGGKVIQLYIPESGEVSFIYDPQTHIMTSSPYSGAPQDVSKVSITIYPNELDLNLNPDSGEWEGSAELAAGCYSYEVRETLGCEETSYGGNLFYLPLSGEITFRYNPETHITNTTPYNGVPEEVTNVNLFGSLDGVYGTIPLSKNEISGKWEGTYLAPAGCYAYRVEETFACSSNSIYGENGEENGNEIQLSVPSTGEISFSYDPETHRITSTPYTGAPEGVTQVSLLGSFQEEFGCDDIFNYYCDKPALTFNSGSGLWEGSFTLPAGCHYYRVKETIGCINVSEYGENGAKDGSSIGLYVPTKREITFKYDPQTHEITSSPYEGIPQDVTAISLFGSLQSEVGCAYDSDPWCDGTALEFNAENGLREGSFTLPAGCYTYRVKETFGCETKTYYGNDGAKSGDDIWLFVPSETEITFSYDPQTHLITSLPYTDISTVNQCPVDIIVDNTPGTCGAIVNYPDFVATAICGGDVSSVTQTAGFPGGSEFPIGTTTNTYELVKTTGEVVTCSFDVIVTDTEAPVITDVSSDPETIWPPNHKMVPVFVEYSTLDNCSVASIELIITSNEPETGPGNSDKAPDWEIIDEHNILLRAERSGKGDGREYYITIKVTDDSGNSSEEMVTIKVANENAKTTTSIATEFRNGDYVLYPDPVDEVLNIKGPKSTSGYDYVIHDMSGAKQQQGKIRNDQVGVEKLSSGTYILEFNTAQGLVQKQFIKK